MTTASADYDPFDEFNRHQGAGSVRNPYPAFAAMRKRGPVHKVNLRKMLGEGTSLPPGTADEVYVVVTHDAVAEVLRDGETFSSKGYAPTMGKVMGHTILEMDEPEHSRYRGLIQRAFSRGALERWEKELIGPVVNRFVDAFAGRGRADLVRELTFPFPVAVIAGMIGLDEEDHEAFHRAAVELISISIDWDRAIRGAGRLREMFARVLAERRREPRDDLVSVLAHSELDGTKLGDDEIFAFLLLLAPAGAETTYRSSSNLLFGLLSHPDQLEALRDKRLLMPRAIEEGLRWEAPLLSIMRHTTRAVRIGDTEIPADAVVSVNLGSANHDETRYEDPDSFDIFREAKAHIAFGFGPHRCLGMHLARMETRVLLDTLFERLPNLRLDPEAEDVHITGMIFRSPLELPVRFDPA